MALHTEMSLHIRSWTVNRNGISPGLSSIVINFAHLNNLVCSGQCYKHTQQLLFTNGNQNPSSATCLNRSSSIKHVISVTCLCCTVDRTSCCSMHLPVQPLESLATLCNHCNSLQYHCCLVQTLRCADFYAGCGGLSFIDRQTDKVNITTKWAVDFCESMTLSFRANYPETEVMLCASVYGQMPTFS